MAPVSKERSEISSKDKWNVEAFYPNLEAWKSELNEVGKLQQKPHFPEILAFKEKLGEGAATLKKFLDTAFGIERRLSKLYTYAHLRYDEDLANEEHKKINGIITMLYHDFGKEISWAEPEMLSLPDKTIESYLKDPVLEAYRTHIERIFRLKPHTLSSKEEELLAMAGNALSTSGMAFSAFNNADLKFPPIKDSKGNSHELTHAKYMFYLREKDRELRKNAFVTLHHSFFSYENTIGELFKGHMQLHVFHSRARHYPSCLEAALFPNQIDLEVYKNLIRTVRENLPILHKYMELRKRILGLDELHMYDLHIPLVKTVDLKYDYETAEKMVVESVAPLGKEYQSILGKGLKQDRWVDRYENKRKRSGAYSSGCYDSMPYILMNFDGAFHDLMTLAHEAGHSMHSFLSHKTQPYQYSNYPIFVAEVASTFNEELMFDYLMKKDFKKEERAFLINQKIEDIRGTFFRQTMFAEFELKCHELAENDEPLTPGLLKEIYYQLNKDYFGPDVKVDETIQIEWARIPHFYSNFYVYQYATGISAAHALFERVMQMGEEAKKSYLQFLSSGCKNYPLDLLNQAGVNMRKKEPILSMIKHFEKLVSELSKLI